MEKLLIYYLINTEREFVNVKEIIYLFFCTIIMMLSTIYVWHILLDKKMNWKTHKLYITISGMTIITMLNNIITNAFLKIVIITIFFIFLFYFQFNEKIQKSIITPMYSQILTILSEIIYTIILVIIFEEPQKIINASYGTVLTNLIISILLLIIIQFKFVRKLYKKLLNITDKINLVHLTLFGMLLMMVINIVFVNSYYKIDFKSFLVLNIVLIFICLVIVIYTFRTQNKYNKVSDKYNIAIKSLNDYEDMMTKYRVANHENKNLLLTVRAMILNNDKDIPKYIDSIIEEKYIDDEKLLFEMSVIPSGGLRATIYSEILKIKENKINYSLNIDRKINTVDLINLETNTIVEICKIIGVFIDNSIEALKGLRQKNIDIQLYIENKNLCIKVSNNYKGNIQISKINDEGYTTKSKGHGYGLSLVKKIVDSNDKFIHNTEISKTIFSQVLIIKYKKIH